MNRVHSIWIFVPLMVCLLLAYSSSAAKQQHEPADSSDDKIYGARDVDQKAVINQRRCISNIPSGDGCEKRRGWVRVIAVFRKTGKVTDVEIRDKSECEVFDKRALKAVKNMKFKPAIKNGVAVSSYRLFDFTYTVD